MVSQLLGLPTLGYEFRLKFFFLFVYFGVNLYLMRNMYVHIKRIAYNTKEVKRIEYAGTYKLRLLEEISQSKIIITTDIFILILINLIFY